MPTFQLEYAMLQAIDSHITLDTDRGEYTVWDETDAYAVCITPYLRVAKSAQEVYATHYLLP